MLWVSWEVMSNYHFKILPVWNLHLQWLGIPDPLLYGQNIEGNRLSLIWQAVDGCLVFPCIFEDGRFWHFFSVNRLLMVFLLLHIYRYISTLSEMRWECFSVALSFKLWIAPTYTSNVFGGSSRDAQLLVYPRPKTGSSLFGEGRPLQPSVQLLEGCT